jgi:hypothetical protein
MRQIIIIDKVFDSYQDLKTKLEEILTIEITEISDVTKAQALISILPELDCIVTSTAGIGEKNITMLENYLVEENLLTPVFILGNTIVQRKETKLLSASISSEELFSQIKDQFLKNDSKKLKENIPLFIPIDFQYVLLHKDHSFPVDFYIRIKRGEEEYQYLKRLHAGDKFNQEELDRFAKHQITSLYVQRNDYMIFLKDSIQRNHTETISNMDERQVKKAFDYFLSREILSLTGVDEETENQVKENIQHMEKAINENASLIHYLNHLKKDQNGFAFVHSMLVALILNKVVGKFEWESQMIREKICYAAFFHDIALLDDKLSRIHSEEELSQIEAIGNKLNSSKIIDGYPSNAIEMVNHHALNSAFILEKIESVPAGVSQIVKEHHGAKNGMGFNTAQSISLHPLSMLFMVVEDFVLALLKLEKPTKEVTAAIIQELQIKYVKSNYKKAVEALALIMR